MKFSTPCLSDFNVIFASLILPSCLFPIKYSSMLLLVIFILIIWNLNKIRVNHIKVLVPFIIYFLSIVIITINDVLSSIFNFEFLLRNSIILVIPLFIFISNFSKKEINRILANSAVLISIIGISFLFLWIKGYYDQLNLPELEKDGWFKNEVLLTNINSKHGEYKIEIPVGSKNPSLRRVAMLDKQNGNLFVNREFSIKSTDSLTNPWILLRNVNTGNEKVWINLFSGEIGKKEGEPIIKVVKLQDGFYKVVFSNLIKLNSNREWYYISFVSQNESYRWSPSHTANIFIKDLKFISSTGKNYLKSRPLLKTSLRENTYLLNYGHGTYFGLIFLFSFSFFLFHFFDYPWLRITSIFIHSIILVLLASKAIYLTLFLLLGYLVFKGKERQLGYIIAFGLVFLTSEFLVGSRLMDFFKTLFLSDSNFNYSHLKELSTGNRIMIYQNYVDLILRNPIFGYGVNNGALMITQKIGSNFNAHNQFLQSIFDGGIAGIFGLLFLLFKPIINWKKWKLSSFELIIIICFLFNSLFESLLFRQWGLLYFSFIFAIVFRKRTKEIKWFP